MIQQALTARPTVLLYGFRDPARLEKLRDWLTSLGVRPLEVTPADYHQKLGALLELPGCEPRPPVLPGPLLEEEMLVLFALPELNAFLRLLRETGLAPAALKAVATPTNIQWTGRALFEALRAERAQIQIATKQKEKNAK